MNLKHNLYRQILTIVLIMFALIYISIAIILPKVLIPFYEKNIYLYLKTPLDVVRNDVSSTEIDSSIAYIYETNDIITVSSNLKDVIDLSPNQILENINGEYGKFEYQKKFDDCKHINHLIFDFYLPETNAIIEYDGEFHYRDVHGGLEIQKIRDSIKNEYCYKNNIKLIRIPFYKFNEIEDILNKYIYGNIVPSQLEMTERCND